MDSIPPSGAGQKPEESLLDQRRRLHDMDLPVAPKVPSRKPMQLGTNQR